MSLHRISVIWLSIIAMMLLVACGEEANTDLTNSTKESLSETANVTSKIPPEIVNSPDWVSHIDALPEPRIPAADPITLRFSHQVIGDLPRGTAIDGIFVTEPKIPMTVVFTDANTLQVVFEEPLIRNVSYRGMLFPQKLAGVKNKLAPYQFTFQAIKQDFSVQLNGLRLDEKGENYILSGVLETQDVVDLLQVEKVIAASHNDQLKSLQWQYDGKHRYTFSLSGLSRKKNSDNKNNKSSLVSVEWDGRFIDVDKKGQQTVSIPALDDFLIVDAIAHQRSDQYIEVSFSDLLHRDQSFKGLVTVNGKAPKNTRIDGNRLLVYPAEKLVGDIELVVFAGISGAKSLSPTSIKNTGTNNTRLTERYIKELTFLSEFPGVRFADNSHIIPKGGDMIVPIEAVNVDAIQIVAYHIPKVNNAQFIQSSNLQESYNNSNTTAVLWRKTYPLPEIPKDKWQRYDVNVSELAQGVDSDFFALSVSVNRSNSLLDCGVRPKVNDELAEPQWPTNELESAPSWAHKYYRSQGYGAWKNRDNPCKSAFYKYNRHDTSTFRYFTASDLGLIAKMTVDRKVRVVVTDINTTAPLKGVTVTAYNARNQALESTLSDDNGFAELAPEDVPLYILATYNDDVNFLRLLRNEALSTNVFDIGGEKTSSGIKGFFYGERDIWRPGDDIFLTFIVQDKAGKFPENYPLTVDFFDPKGNKKTSITNAEPLNNFYHFTLGTHEDDLTGNWRAVIRYGGQYFDKKIPIETIVPNRLKIELGFSDSVTQEVEKNNQPLIAGDTPISIDFFSQWLNGAPASGLKADVAVRASAAKTTISGFDHFTFDDPSRVLKTESQRVFEGKLDAKGRTEFTYKPSVKQTPGLVNLNFTTRVFEKSGNFSTQYLRKQYQPYQQLVGVNIPEGRGWNNSISRNEKHTVALLSIDAHGERIANKELQLSLYRIEWRWWWDYSNERQQSYINDTHSNRIENVAMTTDESGSANWVLDGEKYKWGRYFFRVCDNDGGHCSGKVIYLGWSYQQNKNPSGETQLMLTADKKHYQVGDVATITVPKLPSSDLPDNALPNSNLPNSNKASRLLLTIENGTSILSQKWIDDEMTGNTIAIPITAEMSPNVYAHITLLQAYKGKTNDRPVRLYGIVPLLVDNPNYIVEPVIATADEVRPQSTMDISVTEKQGKAMTYTLAVVDEGLLGVSNYQTPNPHRAFYQREALGVLTWDMYDLLSQSGARALQGLITLGGSDKGKDKDKDADKRRFPPVVKFLGPFHVEANQTAQHTIKLPEYMGAVRVMVVAGHHSVTGQTAYGSAEKTVAVTQPLTLLATLPRVLGPNEMFSLPVSVFVSDTKIKEVTLSVTANTLFEYNTKIPPLVFTGIGDQIVNIPFSTANAIGKGQVTIVASSGDERISQTVNIPIRPANAPESIHAAALIAQGETRTLTLQPNGVRDSNSLMLELSRMPDIGLADRLDYLIAYPHGCLEQTVSQLFPQLYVANLTTLNQQQRQDTEKNIRAGIEKLYRFQQTEGMFSYWPGGGYSNTWANNYAGHFLLEAQRAGYVIPKDMLKRWLDVQQQSSSNLEHRKGYESTHAYLFYTLALASKPNFNGMNRLREYLTTLRTEGNKKGTDKVTYQETASQRSARWLLAAAYARAGVKDAALELMAADSNKSLAYGWSGYSYGSTLRDKSILLLAYKELNDDDKMWQISLQLANAFQTKDRWYSTQTTAWALLTMGAYFAEVSNDENHHFSYQINQGQGKGQGKGEEKGEWQSGSLLSPIFQQRITADSGNDTDAITINIKNEGENPLYSLLSNTGVPANSTELARRDNVSIAVEYADMQGNAIDVKRLAQGTDFVARVTVSRLKNNYAKLENLALSMTMPSGWQISHDRLEGKSLPEGIEYQQVLDDRVNSYFSLGRYHYYHRYDKRTITIETVLNASFKGKFYLPAWHVQSMYENNIKANNVGRWIEVVDAVE